MMKTYIQLVTSMIWCFHLHGFHCKVQDCSAGTEVNQVQFWISFILLCCSLFFDLILCKFIIIFVLVPFCWLHGYLISSLLFLINKQRNKQQEPLPTSKMFLLWFLWGSFSFSLSVSFTDVLSISLEVKLKNS